MAGVAVFWIVGWMWFARYHLLDDALIHLRYADFLWSLGELTFDGVESSYGTSSLLYVLLLVPLTAVTDTPLVVKVVSSVFYLGLIALVVTQAVRSAGLQRALWIGLALTIVSPMGVRWLTDGMETSLVAIMSVALPLFACRASASAGILSRYPGMMVLGAVLLLLRIEMALLVAAASASLWLCHMETRAGTLSLGLRAQRLARIALRDSGLLVGAIGCGVVVYVVFGQLLPDTAVAKSSGMVGGDALRRIGLSTASSLTLGIGLSAMWAASALSAVHGACTARRTLLPLVAANAVIVVVALGVAVRGQEIAGFRNLLWALLFMTTWNVASIPGTIGLPGTIRSALSWRTVAGKTVILGALGLLVVAWTVEGYFVNRIVEGRSQAYSDMREQNLGRLSGLPGVAFDIGFVGYFTRGAICDLSGLVNGREAARLSVNERAERCANRSPVFAFVTPSQAGFLQEYVDMRGWAVCYRYLFTNFRVPEPHYLLVEPRLKERICPQSTSTYGESGSGYPDGEIRDVGIGKRTS